MNNSCFVRLAGVTSYAWRSLVCFACLSAAALSITAGTANLPPKVSIIEPGNGAVFADPTAIKILIETADADGFVRSVEVIFETGSLGQLSPDPASAEPINIWDLSWPTPAAGDHKLVARAVDNEGAVSYSQPVVFTVKRDASPTGATLVIVKPADGDVFTSSPVVVSIQVTAVDPLADIRHVEFYANDALIGRSDQLTKDAVIPGKPRQHFLDWNPATSGRYRLTAKAADSQGNPVVSKPVSVAIAPGLPVVSIETTTPETAEPAPNVRVQPAVFTIRRSGDAANALAVYLSYDGSATPGLDYQPLPAEITFAAGATSVELLVGALEDSAAEGIETVVARITEPPSDGPAAYVIDPGRNIAKVLINDGSPAPAVPTLIITTPKEGEYVKAGQSVAVNATAIDPDGYIARVEFYDFETQIGISQLEFIRAPDPGTPIYHAIELKNPAPGEHSITARAVGTKGEKVVSVPVHFKVVAAEPALPIVRITTVDAEATELSPLVDAIDPARFQITRDGDLGRDLYVVFSLHGTAEPDKDYRRPDRLVRIPAGESAATVDIVPLPDELVEGMETVSIQLEDPLPLSSIPVPTAYAMPDETRRAVAVIYDRSRPEKGALELAFPGNGETFLEAQPLVILAAAFHPAATPGHVDFYAGGKLIGSSDILSEKGISGGLVVHRFVWKAPSPGEQVITASAKLADGTELSSSAVNITVRALNPEPAVSLLRPYTGAVFAAGDRVEIGAVAKTSNGSFQRLEILVDNDVLATAKAPELAIALTSLAPGPHVLVARAVDSAGAERLSIPAKILVLEGSAGSSAGVANTAQVSQIARPSGNNVRLQLSGPANGLCLLEVSSDLVNWEQVPPMFLPDGQIAIEEDAKTGPNCRFYRTRPN